MLQHLLNLTAGTMAVAGSMAAEDRSYELLSATLDGRLLVAFVDYQGTAVAVDLTAERPEIITGLAAGAILSDLRDAAVDVDEETYHISSGASHSQIRVDGDVHVGRANPTEVAAVIDTLPQLLPLQRQHLKTSLGL